jgi:membrane peptidoglycan carboxypeptidase
MPVEPWGIAGIGAAGSQHLAPAKPAPDQTRSIGPERDALITLLQRVVELGTGRGAALPGFAAGKTGTSQDYRDAWFVGFNDALVVGVWVGNDDNTPMDEITGGSLPASIWKAFMAAATPLADDPELVADADASLISGTSLGQCDYRTCAARYRSFRASDCSYQPYGGGPRQACPFGRDGPAIASGETVPSPAELEFEDARSGETVAAGACDVGRCAETYSSFRASDCTYQPFSGGPRRLCRYRLGGLAEGARRSLSRPSAEPVAEPGLTLSDGCNIAVCARFYASFRASDCSYQPYGGGPRQLCQR